MGRASVALIATLCAATLLGAQSDRQTRPRFRGGIDVVQLDVTVLDAKRRPVRGLTVEDFVVLEDGQLQTPIAFSEVMLPLRTDAAAAWTRETGPDVASNENRTRRRVVLVMDDAFTGFYAGEPRLARLIGHAAIDQLGPTDLAAVVFTFAGRAQEFTADRTKLRAAVESFVPRNSSSAGVPLGCRIRPETCAGNVLLRIGDLLRDAEGPKVVVLISPTATFRSLTGPGVVMGLAGERLTMTDVLRTMRQSNVRVYAFHPSGLAFDSTLLELSEGTGARATVNTNAPEDHVHRVFDESASYYALAYEPLNLRADSQFRKIKVEIRGRSGFTVLTKSGYEGPKRPSTRPAETQATEIAMAIARGLPTGDLSMTAVTTALAVPGRREAEVIAVVQIEEDVEDQGSSDRGPIRRTVSLASAAFDTGWDERGSSRELATVTFPAGARGRQTYAVATRLNLRPGRYQLRLAAESSSRVGSVFVDLTVPNFDKEALAFAGPVLARADAVPFVAKPGVMDRLRVVPTLARVFGRDEQLTSFTRLYQGGGGPVLPVTVVSNIVNDRDLVVSTERLLLAADRFGQNRMADVRMDVGLGRLAPGEYVLITTATADKHAVERRIRVAVR